MSSLWDQAVAPAWAQVPEPVVPAWAVPVQQSAPVDLADLLASSFEESAPVHPAGRVITDEELAEIVAQAREEAAVEVRAQLDSAQLAALAALPFALQAARTQADEMLAEAIAAQAGELVEVALTIAEWICCKELAIDPELPLALAEKALEDAGGAAGAVVTVPSSLHRAATSWARRLGQEYPEIVEDTNLEFGTVAIRRGDANGEVSVARALQRAAAALGVTHTAPEGIA